MHQYQLKYIDNCRRVYELQSAKASPELVASLTAENTALISDCLFPVLDNLYEQDADTLAALEEFADALTKGPAAIDIPLASELLASLLGFMRRQGSREDVIRLLYKLGMARYGLWHMISGLDYDVISGFTNRMRYCFAEAAGYLRHFGEFDETTQSYILRSLANIYLGSFEDWHDKLDTVRYTMQVFTDETYRAMSPNLPWDRYTNTIHQQMTGILPHTLQTGEVTPDMVADVMESVQLLYLGKVTEVADAGGAGILAPQVNFAYYSLEYRCGLITADELLAGAEAIMDSADADVYDTQNAYKIVSLPAFYAQYLMLMPDQITPRIGYIASLYDRLMRYIENMPRGAIADQIILYARQILTCFIEVEGGLTYREFAVSMIKRFSPEIYSHGHSTGVFARTICRRIMEVEPNFFDEVPEVAAAENKAETACELAYYAGLLHDLGKINFASFYNHSGREYLSVEQRLMELHTVSGYIYLRDHASTRSLADSAHGTHRFYDGSGGYPEGFNRQQSPTRALVDLIAVCDFLDCDEDERLPFDRKIAEATSGEGRRFSPLITGWLRDRELYAQLKDLYGSR